MVRSTLTKTNFRRIFDGSEAVVCGRLKTDSLTSEVKGQSASGNSSYSFTPTLLSRGKINSTASYSERLWAYLTIQQLLDKRDGRDTYNNVRRHKYTHEALQLALRVSTGTYCGKVLAKWTCVWQDCYSIVQVAGLLKLQYTPKHACGPCIEMSEVLCCWVT